jgi:osmoprotectant transport system ATP-binding protein
MGQRYPAQLSGGQQQRVGVARALAADPPILLMDEPFSAVDPVVRESLQDELLRLQSELGKTIVFVTHDIDEAVKLGDKVAVLRVGGKLAQYAEPGELLARPVDDFVDSFVGRDRGYRGLGFLTSDEIQLGELRTVAVGDPRPADGGWVLVVDAERRPQGWLGPVAAGAEEADGAVVDAEHLLPGGSLYELETGSLRSALDAALSSPSGVGVAVDADGRVAGAVSADDVLRVLDDARRDGDDPAAA